MEKYQNILSLIMLFLKYISFMIKLLSYGHHLGTNLPYLTILGTSAASQGPKAIAKA